MDGTEAEAICDVLSVEEEGVSESVIEAGAACPPVPEVSASVAEFPEDQVSKCPEQHPMPRDTFIEDPQTVPEDVY